MQCSCNVNVSNSGGNGEVSGDEQSTNSPTPVVTSVPSSFVTSVPNMVLEDAAEIDPENAGMRWERESSGTDSVSDVVALKGRLKDCISFWKDVIRPPASIISTIESGYVLPLKSEPTSYVRSNHQSASKNSSFVQESISELCATGCVVAVPVMPHICSPLSVVESSSGKKRLVINLRHLNRFLWKQTFKYEDLRVAMLLLERGDYMFSFDLKSGYHHMGGHHQLFSPAQLTVNASTASEPGFQHRLLKRGTWELWKLAKPSTECGPHAFSSSWNTNGFNCQSS